jgi:hypothetical protein
VTENGRVDTTRTLFPRLYHKHDAKHDEHTRLLRQICRGFGDDPDTIRPEEWPYTVERFLEPGLADWFAAGGTAAQLLALEEDADAEPARDDYPDIPSDVQERWRAEWQDAAATGAGRFYSTSAFLDDYLRSDEQCEDDPIPGVLPVCEVMMLVGVTGSGKTTALVGLAVQKATARPIFDAWACTAGVTLYCATEDLHGVAQRLAAALAHEGLQVSGTPIHIYDKLPALIKPPVFGQKSVGGKDFFFAVRAAQYRGELPERIALVILDYLRNATEGASENSNDDMSLAMDAANRIARALACGVILAAHTGKGDEETARGAQVIKDKAYCVATLKGRADIGATTPVQLTFTKNPKGAARPEPLHLQLTHTVNGGVVMLPVAAPITRAQRETVIRIFRDNGNLQHTTKELSDLAGQDVRMTVSRMLRAGDLATVGNSKPARYLLSNALLSD